MKQPGKIKMLFNNERSKRQDIYRKIFGAPALCAAGFLTVPAMLFNPDPYYKMALFIGFWFLCWLAGKKNNPITTIIVVLFIIAFNLIVPYGEVLYSAGFLKITRGALMSGIQKAATLEGLIMLSRLAIRGDLKIPGFFGELIGESIKTFSLLTESKFRITRKNLMADIDQLLLDLSDKKNENEKSESRTRPAGFVILAAVVITVWLPWFFI